MGDPGGRAKGEGGSNPLIGATVGGKYVVEAWRAAGGMGVVYVARQQPLDREVALKVLALRHDEVDPDFEKRFYLEAATCAKLSHPNIVVVHDYGRLEPEQGGACFMVMELVNGRTIQEAVEEDGPFDAGRAVRVARDAARALRAAHRHGVIHRDLKPSNLMLEPSEEEGGERVKVLDFGLVKVLQDDADQITQEGEFLGSPKYMAPEQIEHATVDGRTDLYSLGALLYLMLTGHPPFVRDSPMQTIMAHLEDPPPPMAEHGVEVPTALEQLTLRCLEKSPADRFASADTLLSALADVWAQLAADPAYGIQDRWRATTSTDAIQLGSASQEAYRPDITPPPMGRARKLAFGLLGLGVAALAVTATLTIQQRLGEPPTPTRLVPRPEPVAVTVSPVEPRAVEPEPAPTVFSLLVESTPQRAQLSRDGVLVGLTPIAIELDVAELERRPVMLALSLPRHYPFAWTQGPLGRDGRIQANLVRETRARQPRPARPREVRAAEATPRSTPTEPTTPSPTVLPWARPNPY